MAGAVAEAGAGQEAAAILNALIHHAIAMAAPRDAPMRLTRCRGSDLSLR